MNWRQGQASRMATAEQVLKPRKRYGMGGWCRLDNGFFDNPMWRAVADELHMPLHQVQAFVGRLESFANKATMRGSHRGYVGDFNPTEFGTACGMPPEHAARIYAALERPDVGWIEQDTVHDFWLRNPDQEDATAAERQRRRRERIKAMRELARARALGLISEQQRLAEEVKLLGSSAQFSTGANRHGVTPRDSVTVTTRSDHISKKAKEGTSEQDCGQSLSDIGAETGAGEPDADGSEAEIWLAFHGKRIVVERCRTNPNRAWLEISRWRRDFSDDVAALKRAIEDADLLGKERGKFTDHLRDAIVLYGREGDGQRSLPLPPQIIARRGHG